MAARNKVQSLREGMGLTREAFAHKVGVDTTTIWRWETGKKAPSPLSRRRLREIANPPPAPRTSPASSPASSADRASTAADRTVTDGPSFGVVPSRRLDV